jgi:hypothetical protein
MGLPSARCAGEALCLGWGNLLQKQILGFAKADRKKSKGKSKGKGRSPAGMTD